MIEKKTDAEYEFARRLMGKIPQIIRVGLFDFRIELMTHHQAAGVSRWGEFSSVEQLIRLQADMPTRYKAVDTFFHEVSHAIFWSYGIKNEDNEERIVSALGSALAALHRDNPWLVEWIEGAKL